MCDTQTADPIAVPPVAFDWGYHTMTPNVMATDLQARVRALPLHTFDELQTQQWYWQPPAYQGAADRLFLTVRRTPAGKEVVIADARDKFYTERRIRAGDVPKGAYAMTDDLRAFREVTHRSIVEEAVARGLEVPSRVRCYYPELFIEVPEHIPNRQTFADPAGRLCGILCRPWHETVTSEMVEDWCEAAHLRLADLRAWSDQARGTWGREEDHPDPSRVRADYERQIREQFADLAFYRWLQPLVSPGGVFHVEEPHA
jgi:hypothetical protein